MKSKSKSNHGGNACTSLVLMAGAIFLSAPAMLAQSGNAKGTVNLAGIWSRNNGDGGNTGVGPDDGSPGFGFTMEEPKLQPWAEAIYKEVRKGVTNRLSGGLDEEDPSFYPFCMPEGMPRVYTTPSPFEIVQTPDRIVMLWEVNLQRRQIYTDGRKMPQGVPLSFLGTSIGKWDGDTLVAETTNLNNLTWVDNFGPPHSKALRVEERFRRTTQDKLQIDFLFDDPAAFVAPWKGKKVYRWMTDWNLLEYNVCEDHEREDYLQNGPSGTRQ